MPTPDADLLTERSMRVHPVVAPVREQVVRNLRQAIVEQRFRPGQRLVERDLCELTQASRTAVREALRQLEVEGLVAPSPRGPLVARITATEAQSLFEVRARLEGLAGARFAERADATQREALRTAVAELRQAGDDPRRLLLAKDHFYDVLLAGAGNDVARAMLDSIRARVAVLRATSLSATGRPARAVAETERIVDAVERRDAVAAEAACQAHVEAAAASALALLEGATPSTATTRHEEHPA